MKTAQHGITIDIDRIDSKIFLSLKATGILTHEDYKVITPMIDSALSEVDDPQVDAILDCTECDGWGLRAAWDDFKLGLKHGKEFRKVAIYGNKNWQETAAKVGSWFIAGHAKYFENKDDAIAWLKE